MSKTAIAFAGFASWALLLLIMMEAIRSWLVMSRQVAANQFQPGNENLSPFMQRLARAHLNCIEGLAMFGGLMVVALVTGKSGLTDGLALWFLLARLVQSCCHLASLSVAAVTLRFAAFAVQLVIGAIWAVRLLAALL